MARAIDDIAQTLTGAIKAISTLAGASTSVSATIAAAQAVAKLVDQVKTAAKAENGEALDAALAGLQAHVDKHHAEVSDRLAGTRS